MLLELIATERITEMFLVPAVLMLLLATPSLASTDLSSVRLIFYGASPISEDVLVKCMAAFGCAFCQVYGMTETTGAITALPFEDHDPDGPRRGLLRSAGKPHRSVELRIVDPTTGVEVGAGCGRGGVDALALQHGGLLGASPPRPRRPSTPTAGCVPAMPATSTPRDTSTSTTGSRT